MKVTAQSPKLGPFQSPSGYVIKIQGLCSPPTINNCGCASTPPSLFSCPHLCPFGHPALHQLCHSGFCWPWAPFALPACIPLTLPALLLPAGLPHLLLPTVDKARLAWPFTMQLLAALGFLPKAACSLVQITAGFLTRWWTAGWPKMADRREMGRWGSQREGSPFGY